MISSSFIVIISIVSLHIINAKLFCPAVPVSCASHRACGSNSDAKREAIACACEAMSAMQSTYCDDWWESWLPSMWQTAVGMEAVANYAAYGAPLANLSAVSAAVEAVANGKDSFLLIAEDPDAYDDLLWFVLAFARLYEIDGNASYLRQANDVFDYVYLESWDTKYCGGGFFWSAARDYKNAITNELGIASAYKLALLLPKPNRYGAIGDAALQWFLASGMINSQSLINDGLYLNNCSNNGQWTWTYNQGVIFLGLALGAHRQPQNAAHYTQIAANIFAAVAKYLTDQNGVLVDPPPGNPTTDTDQYVFKGIYVRYLRYMRDLLHSNLPKSVVTAIDAFLVKQLRSAVSNDRQNAIYGVMWQGPWTATLNNKTGATQISALDMLTANL
jgi:predicted alpha-1,6-mannanase (GH76 family)